MESLGWEFLFNLSLIAITFTVVIALVMLLRERSGSSLSSFDIHLINAYVAFGFAQTIAAVLPSLVALFELSPHQLWAISSLGSVGLLAGVSLIVYYRRLAYSRAPISLWSRIGYSIDVLVVLLLVANAIGWPGQGVAYFAAAVTLSLSSNLLIFASQIFSPGKSNENWDIKSKQEEA